MKTLWQKRCVVTSGAVMVLAVVGTGVSAKADYQVQHDWLGTGGVELMNSGLNGSINDAVLTNNGLDPVLTGDGTATVVNGGTPRGEGGDDGYIDLGIVPQFQGATRFELSWNDLDIDEVAGDSSTLGGALAPGFSAGSLMTLGISNLSSGTGNLSVRLYEAGGAFGGGDEDEVTEGVDFESVLPVTSHDLRIVYLGNGLTQAEGGIGEISVYVDDVQVGQQAISIGILNPDEDPVAFGLGKYHNGSSVAGQYTTGTFSILVPEPTSVALLTVLGCMALTHSRRNRKGEEPSIR